jgi:hypothetical protein
VAFKNKLVYIRPCVTDFAILREVFEPATKRGNLKPLLHKGNFAPLYFPFNNIILPIMFIHVFSVFQRTAIISLNDVNRLIVAMETRCFFYEVASHIVFTWSVDGQVN